MINITGILKDVIDGIAHRLHPEKPREWFEHVTLPSDLSPAEVSRRLDELAVGHPEHANWRYEWVALLKLSHPKDPDFAASYENRAFMYDAFGGRAHFGELYNRSADHNKWCLARTFDALIQRGMPMPPVPASRS